MLARTLEEEKATDKKLTAMAEQGVGLLVLASVALLGTIHPVP